jgi:hypothetical protein
LIIAASRLYVVGTGYGHPLVRYGHFYPGDMDKYADRLDDAAGDATGKAKTRPDDEEDDPDES